MPGQGVTIGVDLGGTKLVAAVVDGAGRPSPPQRWPARVTHYAEALDAISDLVAGLRRVARGRGEDVVAVGVAAAAFLTADRARVRQATNLAGWRDRPFRADLSERLGLPVVIENDADAAVWGEYTHGAGQEERCLVMATVGTGIGGGIVIGGHLITGGSGLAGEFGHLQVVADGLECGCGARGCLELYASGTALVRFARAAAAEPADDAGPLLARAGGELERIDGPLITALAIDGDPLARRALADLGQWVGRGLAQVATVLDPSMVLIGGGLTDAAGDLVVGPARAEFAACASIRAVRPVPAVRRAALGNAAGLVGAATLASVAGKRSKPHESEMVTRW